MLQKKYIKSLKIIYLVFATLVTISMLFAKPEFSTSSKDALIYKVNSFVFFFIVFLLPGIFIISASVRKKIPFFKKVNLKSTIIGWLILFMIGITVHGLISNFYSSDYIAKEKAYNIELAAKKEAEAKAKAEEKAEAKAKAEEKAKAEAESKVAAERKKAEEKLAEEIKANKKDIDKIASVTSLSSGQSLDVLKVLKSVGITSIDKIENKIDMGSGSVGYTVNGTFIMILKDTKVLVVSINDRGIMLYDSTAGGVKGQANDYILTDSEITHYITQAQDIVTRALKAPSTAKFPSQIWELDKYRMSKNKDIITVQSYVDSQNSFGAMTRNEWTVQMNTKEGKYTYLALGGKVLMGKYIKVQ